MKKLRSEEEWVRLLLEQSLQAAVVQNDDCSQPGMYDLRIQYADDRSGAAEVTSAADAQRLQTWKEMNGGQGYLEAPGLGRWMVEVQPGVSLKALYATLHDWLKLLLASGLNEYRNDMWRFPIPPPPGVVHAHHAADAEPGRVYLLFGATGGFVPRTGDCLTAWLEMWLPTCQAKVDKLLVADADERHLVVVVPGFTTAPFEVADYLMSEDPAKTMPTDLVTPHGLDHVWVFGAWNSGPGYHWDGGSWSVVEKPLQHTNAGKSAA